jgi:hypothetical protein
MKAPVQRFALVVGAVYLLVGIVGFAVTGFSGLVANGDKALLGFDLNPFHNIVHMVVGAILIAAARSEPADIAAGVSLGTGAVLLIAAGAGFTNNLQLLSINSATAADNGLHLVTGLAAVLFGLLGAKPRPVPVPVPAATTRVADFRPAEG